MLDQCVLPCISQPFLILYLKERKNKKKDRYKTVEKIQRISSKYVTRVIGCVGVVFFIKSSVLERRIISSSV